MVNILGGTVILGQNTVISKISTLYNFKYCNKNK